ncbi:MAG: DNA-processing protein DprA [Anaerolineaceae bacterium]|nr:DNA-processing protein DprA [Anaerolineaceae bacterium]
MNERQYWLAFSQVRGIGSLRYKKLLHYFGKLSLAWQASRSELLLSGLTPKAVDAVFLERKRVNPENLEEMLFRLGIDYMLWDDPLYPRYLAEIPQAPPVIYYKGNLLPEDDLAFAIVGTRSVTAYGRQITKDTAECLAIAGVTIVSGLARGVDAIAHQTALDAGGRTLAVLGSGVDIIYPPEHRRLAEKIALNGAVLSDYPPGTKPDAINFPPRNRIISGLARGTLVVEAGERSGALITAKFSVDQGREVFAVPGSVLASMSRGTNALIAQGATPMINPRLILDFLKLKPASAKPHEAASLNADEAEILHAMGSESLHFDELASKLSFSVEKLSALLTMMELKGLVAKNSAMVYSALSEWRY